MGRGRQKAKQTKVARELKYHHSSIDVTALQRELAGAPDPLPQIADDIDDEEDEDASAYYADGQASAGYGSHPSHASQGRRR